MRGNNGLRTRLAIGGLAATGVVAAHSFAYIVASPDPHSRSELLESTGHAGFSTVVAVALGLLAAGLVRLAAGSVWGAGGSVPGRRLYARAVPRLLVLQMGGFVLLEVLERVLTGLSPVHLIDEPVVVIGLLAQALVALLSAGLLVLLAKTFESLLAHRSFKPEASARTMPTPTSRLVPAHFEVASGYGTLRGPPRIS